MVEAIDENAPEMRGRKKPAEQIKWRKFYANENFFFLLNGTNSRFFLFHFSLHVVITTFYSRHRFSSSLFEWGSMTITIISLRGGGGGGYSNSYHFLQNFNANVNKFGYCRQVHLPLSSFLACFFLLHRSFMVVIRKWLWRDC